MTVEGPRYRMGQVLTHKDDVRSKNDFYETSSVATQVLMNEVQFDNKVWEPACGKGAITDVLREKYDVIESDISDEFNRGRRKDFLSTNKLPSGINSIITNPPFKFLNEFVMKALELKPRFVVMHMAVGALGSVKRGKIYNDHPPSLVLIISNTLSVQSRDKVIKSMFNHMWVVWDSEHNGNTSIVWREAR